MKLLCETLIEGARIGKGPRGSLSCGRAHKIKADCGKESNVEIRIKQEYSWEGHPQPLRPPYLEAEYHCPDDAQVSASSLAAD